MNKNKKTMAKSERKFLFSINDFDVHSDSVYVVNDKRDLDAPSGYINVGVSKLPSRGVGETFQVRFESRDNGRTGVWDTGFDEYSPCYKSRSIEEARSVVKGLKTNLLTPYRKVIGVEDAFEKTNEAFFLKTRFHIYSGKTYNTNDPVDLMELYFGLLTNQLTPKGQEGNSKFNDSSYIVIDINKNMTTKVSRTIEKFKAIGSFQGMLKADRERLMSILEYTGTSFSNTVDDNTLITMFSEYLDGGVKDNRVEIFNGLVDETETESGMEKVYLYRALKLESKKPNTKITKSGGVYFYDGMELGPELKSSVENITKNSKLAGVKRDLLLAE